MINPHPLQPTIQTCNVRTPMQEIREKGFEETDGRPACRRVRDELCNLWTSFSFSCLTFDVKRTTLNA